MYKTTSYKGVWVQRHLCKATALFNKKLVTVDTRYNDISVQRLFGTMATRYSDNLNVAVYSGKIG